MLFTRFFRPAFVPLSFSIKKSLTQELHIFGSRPLLFFQYPLNSLSTLYLLIHAEFQLYSGYDSLIFFWFQYPFLNLSAQLHHHTLLRSQSF